MKATDQAVFSALRVAVPTTKELSFLSTTERLEMEREADSPLSASEKPRRSCCLEME